MTKEEFPQGSRLLCEEKWYRPCQCIEVFVVEVAQFAVKVRYRSGDERWLRFAQGNTPHDTGDMRLIEVLP